MSRDLPRWFEQEETAATARSIFPVAAYFLDRDPTESGFDEYENYIMFINGRYKRFSKDPKYAKRLVDETRATGKPPLLEEFRAFDTNHPKSLIDQKYGQADDGWFKLL